MVSFAPLHLAIGPMFAGKTSWLLAQVRALQAAGRPSPVVLVKPAYDTRHPPGVVVDHDGNAEPCVTLASWCIAPPSGAAVLFDEIQFFAPPHFADDIVEVVAACRSRGVSVYAAGLDLDWRGRIFPVVGRLLPLATRVVRLTARCDECGAPATRTGLRPGVALEGSVRIGGAETYRPLCEACSARPWRKAGPRESDMRTA